MLSMAWFKGSRLAAHTARLTAAASMSTVAWNTLSSFTDGTEVNTASTRVLGISSTSYPANAPIEDRHAALSDKNVVLAGVFDGHGGWQCSEFVSERLLDRIVTESRHATRPDYYTASDLRTMIARGFSRTEREWVRTVGPAFEAGFGQTARAGSCAIVAAVLGDALVVGNAGDCRAVLGRKRESGKGLYAVALSRDHNAREPEEQRRLQAEHPGEKDIVICKSETACYTKGRLQPTRSFGDLYLKHPEFNGIRGDRSRGRYIPNPYTPPYITHEPEIRMHTPSDPENDLFLIMGSDGLWDAVSNDEAVTVVATALEQGQDPKIIAQMLAKHALQNEAAASNMPLSHLFDLPPGSARRSKHDDITVVILFLNGSKSYGIQQFTQTATKSWWSKIFGN